MPNPILIELTRGELAESVHRGAIAIADAKGGVRFALGDVAHPVYSRSALKPVQALAWVETGAPEAFGVSEEEVALACASHSGETMHTTRVAAWLQRIGCSEADLHCGTHSLRGGEKGTPLTNNCSGKHTGFLTYARHLNAPTKGYEHADHPVQAKVAEALRDLSGWSGPMPYASDGCTVPNFAIPLAHLATAMARIAAPEKLPPVRAKAARRIVAAMSAHPDLVAGTGRADTNMIRDAQGRAVVKTGAEGVYVALFPQRGLGLALKIDDGTTRASEATMATLLLALGMIAEDSVAAAIATAPVKNNLGEIVGQRRAAPELRAALKTISAL